MQESLLSIQEPLLSLGASAGSGKTHQLTGRYLNLLFLGAKPSSILTLTFTKKAAKEMKERILKEIHALYTHRCDRKYVEDCIKKFDFISIKDNISTEDFALLQEKIVQMRNAILSENLNITTFDSFFQKILRSFCWYVDVEYDFTIKKDNEHLIREIFLETLYSSMRSNYDFILESCYKDTKKDKLNDICSTCKLLDDFKEMLKPSLFKKDTTNQTSSAQERAMQFAKRIQKAYYDYFNKEASSLQFDTFEGLLAKGITWLKKPTLQDYRGFTKLPSSPSLQKDFESLKQAICDSFLEEEASYLVRLYEIFQCFLKAKESYYRQNHSLSFKAATSKVYELLAHNKIGHDFLYFRLDSAISHILIDEFQDTSVLQYEILLPLIEEIKAGIGQKNFLRSFFYVGDVKQSIYRFRGGNPHLFKIAAKQMCKKDLKYNYRSAKNIVEFVNATFADKMEDFIPQIPKSEAKGFVQVIHCEKDTIYSEVSKTLESLKQNGIPDENIAILTFDNKIIIELAQFLEEKKYKVLIDTSAKLINHNEVRAMIELLRFLQTQNTKFKEEFFALLGLESTEDDEFETFLPTLENCHPAQCLLKIMEKYRIASLSAKKFLEHSMQYARLEDLLGEIDSIALDVVSSDFSGIRIMTIHKSKGLEFENVLIVDKTGQNTHFEKILFDYEEDGVGIKELYRYNNKTNPEELRQSLDANYSCTLLKESQHREQDLKNQLYVALTRAKNAMFLFTFNSSKEKNSFKILELKEGTYGDFQTNINEQKSQTEQDLESNEFCDIPKMKHSLEELGRQREIHTKEKDTEEEEYGSLESLYYGIALHFTLEQKIKHHINDDLLLEILNNQYGFFLNPKQLEKIIAQSNLIQKNKNFIEIMAKGSVKCEVPFLSNGKQKRLDLLILGEKEAWIIDYKSGIQREQHKAQVREYVESMVQILHKKTYGYIFYTNEGQEGKIVEV